MQLHWAKKASLTEKKGIYQEWFELFFCAQGRFSVDISPLTFVCRANTRNVAGTAVSILFGARAPHMGTLPGRDSFGDGLGELVSLISVARPVVICHKQGQAAGTYTTDR